MTPSPVPSLWHVVGASVRGTSHARHSLPCQDAHQCKVLENGLLLIAAADGAGSAPRAAEGASAAVKTALSALESRLVERIPGHRDDWEDLVIDTAEAARSHLEQLSSEQEIPLRHYATTLSMVIADHEWLITGQIGDGIVVARQETGDLFLAAPPQAGEYAGETYFLTMPDALDHLEGRIYAVNADAIAVMTDGLVRLALQLPDHHPHALFFEPLMAFPVEDTSDEAQAHLAAFLNSSRINARTDDDKTLVLAARPRPEVPAAPES